MVMSTDFVLLCLVANVSKYFYYVKDNISVNYIFI